MAGAGNEVWYYVVNGAQTGPAGAHEMAALIQAGKISRDTLVWKEGMAEWQPAGQTELAELFAQAPPPVAASPRPVPPPPGEGLAIGSCLKEGFGLIKQYPAAFLLGNIVFMVINSFAGGLLTGNWYGGVMLMVDKVRSGQPVEFGDIFKGFDRFGQVLGAGLLYSVCVGVASLFFIIPGLLVAAYLFYLIPLVAVRQMSIGDAFKASGKMTQGHLWSHVLFMFVVGLVGMSGIILCYFGVFLTMPVIPIAMGLAYQNQVRAGRVPSI
ncbi:MAG: GYF domain-containing protein [Pseudomonadota bacterium]